MASALRAASYARTCVSGWRQDSSRITGNPEVTAREALLSVGKRYIQNCSIRCNVAVRVRVEREHHAQSGDRIFPFFAMREM